MLSNNGPRSEVEGVDLGLPEQHKVSSLEHADSSNEQAPNMLAYQDGRRQTDGAKRERDDDGACSSFQMGAVVGVWRRSKASKGHGKGGRLALAVGRGGEGGQRRVDNEQELKASDAG
jgi:hypothetical protein